MAPSATKCIKRMRSESNKATEKGQNWTSAQNLLPAKTIKTQEREQQDKAGFAYCMYTT